MLELLSVSFYVQLKKTESFWLILCMVWWILFCTAPGRNPWYLAILCKHADRVLHWTTVSLYITFLHHRSTLYFCMWWHSRWNFWILVLEFTLLIKTSWNWDHSCEPQVLLCFWCFRLLGNWCKSCSWPGWCLKLGWFNTNQCVEDGGGVTSHSNAERKTLHQLGNPRTRSLHSASCQSLLICLHPHLMWALFTTFFVVWSLSQASVSFDLQVNYELAETPLLSENFSNGGTADFHTVSPGTVPKWSLVGCKNGSLPCNFVIWVLTSFAARIVSMLIMK